MTQVEWSNHTIPALAGIVVFAYSKLVVRKVSVRLFIQLISGLVYFFVPTVHAQPSAAPPATFSDFNTLISGVLAGVIGLIGLVSFAMLLLGGFKYLSAGADKANTDLARNTITYSIAGLIIAISAWAVLSLFGSFFGVNLNVFDICIDTTSC